MPTPRKYFTREQKLAAHRVMERAHRAANRDEINRKSRERYAANRVEIHKRKAVAKRRSMAKAMKSPEAKTRLYEYQREYLRKNPGKAKMFAASRNHKRRHGEKFSATKWANRFFMEEAYDLARRRTQATGFAWHVDHVVPLQSERVCGLHCEQNLAVISASENSRKRNHYWPDMPEAQ